MKKRFAATTWREEDCFIFRCLEVDIASQGKSEEESLSNLREAPELQLEEPRPTADRF